MGSTLASTAHRRIVKGLVPRAAAAVSARSSFVCPGPTRSHVFPDGGRRSLASAVCAGGARPLAARTIKTTPPSRIEPGQCRRQSTSASTPAAAPPFAFAFDIDGVLLHVNEPIPGAAEALRHLHRHNIPFILLTNGGGRYEADRIADLQQRLGLDLHGHVQGADCGGPLPVLSTANFVQSHTPFQELLDNATGLDRSAGGAAAASLEGLRDQTILVTGSDASRIRVIAEKYGFTSVVTPADILAAYPAIYPFDPLLKSVYVETARPLPKPLLLEGGKLAATATAPFSADSLGPSQYLRIAAAFVFNDPRDWALDIQLLTDLLQARRGFLGTFDPASLSAQGTAPHDGARLFFSNSDLLWATTYHLPRFGQGAFAAATAGVWKQMVSPAQPPLLSPDNGRATLLGKPHEATYLYAERTLTRYREALLKAHGGPAGEAAAAEPLKSVYMVGDNPESDIAGANQFASTHGTDWCSVLVETGVYDPLLDSASAGYLRHRPRVIVRDVAAAVRWALQREGWPADF